MFTADAKYVSFICLDYLSTIFGLCKAAVLPFISFFPCSLFSAHLKKFSKAKISFVGLVVTHWQCVHFMFSKSFFYRFAMKAPT